ncbi:MAG: hypothetical protein ACYS32_10660 [Planctomycetota bacterium]
MEQERYEKDADAAEQGQHDHSRDEWPKPKRCAWGDLSAGSIDIAAALRANAAALDPMAFCFFEWGYKFWK